MKNLFILIITFLLLTSCSEQEIYKKGRKWTFSVQSSESKRIDTLTLVIEDEPYRFKYRWDYKTYYPDKTVKKGSSIISDESILFRDNDILELKAPAVMDVLAEAQYLPNPQIEIPPNKKFSKEIEFLIPSVKQVSRIYAPDDSLQKDPKITKKMTDSVKVQGSIKATGSIFYKNKTVKDSCIVLKAYGKSRKGRFNATYYFHELYGFVYFYYNLGKKTVEVKLIKKEF